MSKGIKVKEILVNVWLYYYIKVVSLRSNFELYKASSGNSQVPRTYCSLQIISVLQRISQGILPFLQLYQVNQWQSLHFDAILLVLNP